MFELFCKLHFEGFGGKKVLASGLFVLRWKIMSDLSYYPS